MQETKHLVCLLHVAYPGVPRGIFQTVAETSKHEDYDKHRIWWMDSDDDVRKQMHTRAKERYASLAKMHVDSVVKES